MCLIFAQARLFENFNNIKLFTIFSIIHFHNDCLASLFLPHLFLGWHVSCEEEVEESLGKRLLPSVGSWEELLALGDRVTTETDALLWIEKGRLCH